MAGCDLHSHHLLCMDFVILDRYPLIDTISSIALLVVSSRFTRQFQMSGQEYRLNLLIFLIRFFSDLCSSMKYHPYSIS